MGLLGLRTTFTGESCQKPYFRFGCCFYRRQYYSSSYPRPKIFVVLLYFHPFSISVSLSPFYLCVLLSPIINCTSFILFRVLFRTTIVLILLFSYDLRHVFCNVAPILLRLYISDISFVDFVRIHFSSVYSRWFASVAIFFLNYIITLHILL